MKEETAQKEIISYNKITQLKKIGKLFYKVEGKWENQVKKNGARSRWNERG